MGNCWAARSGFTRSGTRTSAPRTCRQSGCRLVLGCGVGLRQRFLLFHRFIAFRCSFPGIRSWLPGGRFAAFSREIPVNAVLKVAFPRRAAVPEHRPYEAKRSVSSAWTHRRSIPLSRQSVATLYGSLMSHPITLRPARPDERLALEELQRRASLVWEEYRAELLAHPDAIDLPADQVCGWRRLCRQRPARRHILGFSVVLAREDGDAELDGLFVEPSSMEELASVARLSTWAMHCRRAGFDGAHRLPCDRNPLRRNFIAFADFHIPARRRPGSDRHAP